MRYVSLLLLLLLCIASTRAEDGLILHEPSLETATPVAQTDMTELPSEDITLESQQSCDSEQQTAIRRHTAQASEKTETQKPKQTAKKDPGMLDWMFTKPKMPSLHFIDLLEIIH